MFYAKKVSFRYFIEESKEQNQNLKTKCPARYCCPCIRRETKDIIGFIANLNSFQILINSELKLINLGLRLFIEKLTTVFL